MKTKKKQKSKLKQKQMLKKLKSKLRQKVEQKQTLKIQKAKRKQLIKKVKLKRKQTFKKQKAKQKQNLQKPKQNCLVTLLGCCNILFVHNLCSFAFKFFKISSIFRPSVSEPCGYLPSLYMHTINKKSH